MDEVALARLRRLHALDRGVGVDVVRARREEVVDVLRGLVHVALDVHREARRLGDREPEVQRDAPGDAAEPDEDAPHLVDVREHLRVVVQDRALVCGGDDERDEGRGCARGPSARADAGETGGDVLNWPQPWLANTAVMRRPRICADENSEAITADSG